MSQFIRSVTSEHDSNDADTAHGNSSQSFGDEFNEEYPIRASVSPQDGSTLTLSSQRGVARSLGMASPPSPIWGIESLPSTSPTPQYLGLQTPWKPGDFLEETPFRETLLHHDVDLDTFSIVPASPTAETTQGSSSVFDSPGTPLVLGRAHHSPSGSRSERGAEAWSGGTPPRQRTSPYPSPHGSPYLRVDNPLNDDSYNDPLDVNWSERNEGYGPSGLLSLDDVGVSTYPNTITPTKSIPPLNVSPDPRLYKSVVTTAGIARASEKRRIREAKFQCHICGSSFTSKSNLDYHIKSHMGIKPAKCRWPGCGKAFATRHVCKRHERRHAKDGLFVCDVCSKKFTEMEDFHRHLHSEDGASCLKAQKGGESVGATENERSENEEVDMDGVDVDAESSMVEEEDKGEASTSKPPLQNYQEGDTGMDTQNSRARTATGAGRTVSQKTEGSNTPTDPAPASSTQTLTEVKSKTIAVGDRVAFTLKSRHMAGYVATMSAEQQEAFGIEMAQRRLRERNARRAAGVLRASQA